MCVTKAQAFTSDVLAHTTHSTNRRHVIQIMGLSRRGKRRVVEWVLHKNRVGELLLLASQIWEETDVEGRGQRDSPELKCQVLEQNGPLKCALNPKS